MRTMFRVLISLVVMLFVFEESHGQDFLLLSKAGGGKRIKIYTGDDLRFRLDGERFFNDGKIKQLKNDSIHFENSAVHISSISKVDIRGYNKHRVNPDFLGNAAILAGSGYFFVDQFNHTVVKQRGWEVNGTVVRTSAIMIAAGILIKLSWRKYFRVRGENQIKMVTF